MNDTPETDDAWNSCDRSAAGLHLVAEQMRKLERERDEAKAILETVCFHLRRNDHVTPPTGATAGRLAARTCSAFGIQWESAFGKRAFGWTMIDGANGPMILAVTYDPKTEEWDGESAIDLAAVDRVPITGRIPHPAKLRAAIARSMEWRFDHYVRPSGTF